MRVDVLVVWLVLGCVARVESTVVVDVDRRLLTDKEYYTVLGHEIPKMLAISPSKGPTCGGTVVALSGEDFHLSSTILCRFGEQEVSGTFVSATAQVVCSSPSALQGFVAVEVSFDNGEHYSDDGILFDFYEPSTSLISPTSGPLSQNTTISVWGGEREFVGATFFCLLGVGSNHTVSVATAIQITGQPMVDGSRLDCVLTPSMLSGASITTPQTLTLRVAFDTNGDGTFDGSLATATDENAMNFFVYSDPSLSTMAPTTASSAQVASSTLGGVVTVLTGTNLWYNNSLVTPYVRVGDAVVMGTADSDTRLTFVTPTAHLAGAISSSIFEFNSSAAALAKGMTLLGDAVVANGTLLLTQRAHSTGSAVLSLAGFPPLQGFRIQFDCFIGQMDSPASFAEEGGNGISVSISQIPTSTSAFGSLGVGAGLNVLFRTRTAHAVDVYFHGVRLAQHRGLSLRTGSWLPVSIEMSSSGVLSVCCGSECLRPIAVPQWVWEAGWGIGFGAHTTETFDDQVLDNLVVSAGGLTVESVQQVSLSLNGQHYFDMSLGGNAATVRYHAPPVITSVAPLGGDVAGGTNVTVRGMHVTDVVKCGFGSTSNGSLHHVTAAPPDCAVLLSESDSVCLEGGCFASEPSIDCCTSMFELQNWGCSDSRVLCGSTLVDAFAARCTPAAVPYTSRVYCVTPDFNVSLSNSSMLLPISVSVSVNAQDFEVAAAADQQFVVYNKSNAVTTAIFPRSVDALGQVTVELHSTTLKAPSDALSATTVVWIGSGSTEAIPAVWNASISALTFEAPAHAAAEVDVQMSFNEQERVTLGSLLFFGPAEQSYISPSYSLSIGENCFVVVGKGFALAAVHSDVFCMFGLSKVVGTVVNDTHVYCCTPDFATAGAGVVFALDSEYDDSARTFTGLEVAPLQQTLPFAEAFDLAVGMDSNWRVETHPDALDGVGQWQLTTAAPLRPVAISQTSAVFSGHISTAQGTYAVLRGGRFGLGIITTSLMVGSGGVGGVAFRFVDMENHYIFEVHPDTSAVDGFHAFRRVKRVLGGTHTVLAEDLFEVPLFTWANVTIACVDGVSIHVLWDSEAIFTVADDSPALAQGSVALSSWAMPAIYFSQVDVEFVRLLSSVNTTAHSTVSFLGSAHFEGIGSTVVLTNDDAVAAVDGSILFSLGTYHPALVFQASFDFALGVSGTGVLFFYSPAKAGRGVDGMARTGLAVSITPAGTVEVLWYSQLVGNPVSVAYTSGSWASCVVSVTATSFDDAVAGRVAVSVRINGQDVVAGASLAERLPSFAPAKNWVFGVGASFVPLLGNTLLADSLQRVRNVAVRTNFATGLMWPVPVQITLNDRDLVPVTGAEKNNTVTYLPVTMGGVSPTSTKQGDVVQLALDVGQLTTTHVGIAAYDFQCVFSHSNSTHNDTIIASTVASLAVADAVLSCPTTASMEHGQYSLKVQISASAVPVAAMSSAALPFSVFGPTITSVYPRIGSASGGTMLAIGGTNFDLSANLTCRFQGASETKFTTATPNDPFYDTVKCATPSWSVAETVQLAVSLNQADYSASTPFTFHLSPQVTSFFPSSCSNDGGCVVVVTGTNFVSDSNAEYRCLLGASESNATFISTTALQCVSPAFEAMMSNVVDASSVSETVALGALMLHDAAHTATNLEFVPVGGYSFSAARSPSPNVAIVDAGSRLIIRSTDQHVGALLLPAVDYDSRVHLELEVLESNSLYFGVATGEVDLLANTTQAGMFVMLAASGNVVVDGVERSYGASFGDGDLVSVVLDFGSLSFAVNGVDQGVVTNTLGNEPVYFVVGDASVDLQDKHGADVRIVSSAAVAKFDVVVLTPDEPHRTGAVHFGAFASYNMQALELQADLWVGSSLARSLDSTQAQTGGNGFTIQYATLGNNSFAQELSAPYIAVRVQTYPTDAIIQFVSHEAEPQCMSFVQNVRTSAWNPLSFTLDADGNACLSLFVGHLDCCAFPSSTIATVQNDPDLTLAVWASTGDLADMHALRSLRATLTPLRVTSSVALGVSLNAEDFVQANSTFRIVGQREGIAKLIEPGSGRLNETIRIWGTDLADGTNYTCIFRSSSETVVVRASYDEPTQLPKYTDYSFTLSPGPIRCTVPEKGLWASEPAGGSVLNVSVTLNNQDEISNPDITFALLESWSVTSISPHAGPITGGTVLNVTISSTTALQSASLVRCRFVLSTSGESLTVDATSFGGSWLVCQSPSTSAVDTAVVFATLNGQEYFGAVTDDTTTFAFYGTPRVTSLYPRQGYTQGGMEVQLSGTNLAGGSSSEYLCKFVGAATTTVVVGTLSSDIVKCTTPSWSEIEVVEIHISPNAQQYDTTSVDIVGFTFYDTPTNISGPTPSFGPTSGETVVVFSANEFVLGDDPRCRFKATGQDYVVNATADFTKNQISCISPAVSTAEAVSVSISLYGDDYVDVTQKFEFIKNPTLSSFEYYSGFATGGTLLVATASVAVTEIQDPHCQFKVPGRTTAVAANVTSTSVVCVSPPLSRLPVNRFTAFTCTFDSALEPCAADQNLEVELVGDAVVLGAQDVLQLTTTSEADTFGALVFWEHELQQCPLNFVFGADVVAGNSNAAEAVFFSVGSGTPGSISQVTGSVAALVVVVSVFHNKVAVYAGGSLVAESSLLVSLSSGTWHHIDVEAEDDVIHVRESNRDLIAAVSLPAGWQESVITNSSCQYAVGAYGGGPGDEYVVDNVNLFAEVVAPPESVNVTLTLFPNFESSALVFQFTNPLVINSHFPRAGPSTGNTIVEFDCFHVSSAWQKVECLFGSVNVTAAWNSTSNKITCITPSYTLPTSGNTTTTVPLTIVVNDQHSTPSFASEAIYFTFYDTPSIVSVSPQSSPKTGGTIVRVNITGFDASPFANLTHGPEESGLHLSCIFGNITRDAMIVRIGTFTTELECVSPEIGVLESVPSTLSVLLNDSPDQFNQRIGLEDFTYFANPYGTTLSPSSVAYAPSASTTTLVSGLNLDGSTNLYCQIGAYISAASKVSSQSLSCDVPSATEAGAAWTVTLRSTDSSVANAIASGVVALVGAAFHTNDSAINLTPAGEPNTVGGMIISPFPAVADFASFRIEFDVWVDENTLPVAGDGISVSFGEVSNQLVGESGYGLGIRVQLRTYASKRVEVALNGETTDSLYVGETCSSVFFPDRRRGLWYIEDCVPFDQIRNRTNHVTMQWSDNQLVVTFAGQVVANHTAVLDVPPQADWAVVFGARAGLLGDGHVVDNVVVELGAEVADQKVPVLVSLNGQQFHRLADELTFLAT